MSQYREFLKYSSGLVTGVLGIHEHWGVAPPPAQKPYPADAMRRDLTPPGQWKQVRRMDLESAIRDRRSRRAFTQQPITLEELSFLLWATQGVCARLTPEATLRTAPSAGGRHSLETYVCVFRSPGFKAGLYRYLPQEHQLLQIYQDPQLDEKLASAAHEQSFVGQSAATFVWTAIPYRMEWRYGTAAAKFIALEAGHVCQNLYLACEAIGAGTCAVAVYRQLVLDRLLQVDGQGEFAVYLAPVGKPRR